MYLVLFFYFLISQFTWCHYLLNYVYLKLDEYLSYLLYYLVCYLIIVFIIPICVFKSINYLLCYYFVSYVFRTILHYLLYDFIVLYFYYVNLLRQILLVFFLFLMFWHTLPSCQEYDLISFSFEFLHLLWRQTVFVAYR